MSETSHNTNKPLDEKPYTAYTIASAGRPYPKVTRWNPEEHELGNSAENNSGNTALNYEEFVPQLAGVESYLPLSTRRSYAEMMGILHRQMPIPSLLPAFHEGLKLRTSNSKRRILAIQAEPGIGKTQLGETMGLARDPRGAIKFNAAGRNMSELMFRTVVDPAKAQPIQDKIDNGLRDGSLTDSAQNILRNSLGSIMQGNIINWAYDDLAKPASDNQKVDVQKMAQTLLTISQIEGWSTDDTGFRILIQHGPAIQAYKQGRELIVDEADKAKDGTIANEQEFWELADGERPTYTAYADDGSHFEMTRAGMSEGFFVNLYKNGTNDGAMSNALPISTSTRIDPIDIKGINQFDWQHMFSIFWTGLPVSTLYALTNPSQKWEEDPARFIQYCNTIRFLGLNDSEKAAMASDTAVQVGLDSINHWIDFIKGSEQAARYYFMTSEITNPNSSMHRNNASALSGLGGEDLDAFHENHPLSFRTMKRQIEAAQTTRPTPEVTLDSISKIDVENDDFITPPEAPSDDANTDNMSLKVGERFTDIVLSNTSENTKGYPTLYGMLRDLLIDCRFISSDPSDPDAATDPGYTVAELLNINPEADLRISTMTRELYDTLHLLILKKAEKAGADPEALLSLHHVQRILDEMKKIIQSGEQDRINEHSHEGVLYVSNMDLETISEQPIVPIHLVDYCPQPNDLLNDPKAEKTGIAPLFDSEAARYDSLYPEQVVTAMALQLVGKTNRSAIWKKSLAIADTSITPDDDPSLKIAIGADEIGCTTLGVVSENRKELRLVHLIKHKDDILMVGDTISREASKLLRDTGIVYVTRTHQLAANAITDTLQKMNLHNNPHLRDALLKRNDIEGAQGKNIDAILIDFNHMKLNPDGQPQGNSLPLIATRNIVPVFPKP